MAGYPLIQDQRSKMNTRFSTKGGSQTLMPKILKLPPNFFPISFMPPCSSTSDRPHAGKKTVSHQDQNNVCISEISALSAKCLVSKTNKTKKHEMLVMF